MRFASSIDSRDALMDDGLSADDLAIEPMTRDERRDAYQRFVKRNTRAPTMATSNRETSDWLAVSADTLLAQSALDRLRDKRLRSGRRRVVPATPEAEPR